MLTMLDEFSGPFFGQRAQKPRYSLGQFLVGARGILDVRLHPFVAGLTPVGLRYTQDLSDVPTGVVVGVERRVPVLGRPPTSR